MIIIVTACVLLLIYLFAGRVILARRRARADAKIAGFRTILIHAALDVDQQEVALPTAQSREFLLLVNSATRLLFRLRGESRDQLAAFLTSRGIDAQARDQLNRKHSRLRLITCAQFLGALGDRSAFPGLLKLMSDRRWEVRLMGARSIGRLRIADGAPVLLQSVAGHNPLPVGTVAAAAVQLGTAGIPQLVPGTESPTVLSRTVAVLALGQLRAREGLGNLVDLLRHDPSDEVRALAATAVGRIGTREAVDALIESIITEQNPAIKSSACRALADNPSQEALAVLYAEISDPNADVSRSAALALSNAGPQGRELLENLSEDELAPGSDYATEALGEYQIRANRALGQA